LRLFQKNETVELHGLGNAIAFAVEVSQILVANGHATIQSIQTSTVVTPSGVRKTDKTKAKVVVIVKRTAAALLAVVNDDDAGADEGDYE